MPNIPSAGLYINDVEVSADAAITEALFEKIGGTENFLLDENTARISEITSLQGSLAGKLSEVWYGPSTAINTSVGTSPITTIGTFTGLGKQASIYWMGGRFKTTTNGQVALTINGSEAALLLSSTSGGIDGGNYEYTNSVWRVANGIGRIGGTLSIFGGIKEEITTVNDVNGLAYNSVINKAYFASTSPVFSSTEVVPSGGILIHQFTATNAVSYTIGLRKAIFGGGGAPTYFDRCLFRVTY